MTEEKKEPLFSPESPENPDNPPKITADDLESWRSSRRIILGLLPGLILILMGCLFLLAHYGYLKGEWWQYFLVGLGVVLLVESRLQYKVSNPRRAKISRLIAGLLMIISGVLFLFDPNQWWPLVLIGAGIILCLWFLLRKRRQMIEEA